MPKCPKKFTITALNDPTCKYEKITPSKEIREKYKDLCTPRKIIKPSKLPLVQRPLTLEQRLKLQEEAKQEHAEKTLLSRLVMESRRLEDRISSPEPGPSTVPLANRIEPEYADYTALSTTKILKNGVAARLVEYERLFEAVKVRFDPVMVKLNDPEQAGHIDAKDLDAVWSLWNRFEDIRVNMREWASKGQKSKTWRNLSGALKQFGKVNLEGHDKRLAEVCKDIISQDITVPDLE